MTFSPSLMSPSRRASCSMTAGLPRRSSTVRLSSAFSCRSFSTSLRSWRSVLWSFQLSTTPMSRNSEMNTATITHAAAMNSGRRRFFRFGSLKGIVMSVSLVFRFMIRRTSYPKIQVPFEDLKIHRDGASRGPAGSAGSAGSAGPAGPAAPAARSERNRHSEGQDDPPEPGVLVPGPLRPIRSGPPVRGKGVGDPPPEVLRARLPLGKRRFPEERRIQASRSPGIKPCAQPLAARFLFEHQDRYPRGPRCCGEFLHQGTRSSALTLRGTGKKFAEASHPIAGKGESQDLRVPRKPLTRRFRIPVSGVGDADPDRRDIFASNPGRGDSPTLSVDEDLRAGWERLDQEFRFGNRTLPDRFPYGQYLGGKKGGVRGESRTQRPYARKKRLGVGRFPLPETEDPPPEKDLREERARRLREPVRPALLLGLLEKQ